MMDAVSTLFHCRKCFMNADALSNLLILQRGKVDKMCFQRFPKLGFFLSHTSLLRKQFALTKHYRDPVPKIADNLFIDL